MHPGVQKMIGVSGWLFIIVGIVSFFVLGFNLYIVPPDVGVSGIVFDEGLLHPQRWYIAFSSLSFFLFSGLVLLGISEILIKMLESYEDTATSKRVQELIENGDYNPSLDGDIR